MVLAKIFAVLSVCFVATTTIAAQAEPFGDCEPFEELKCVDGRWNSKTCKCGSGVLPTPTPEPTPPEFTDQFAHNVTVRELTGGSWYGSQYSIDNSSSQTALYVMTSDRPVVHFKAAVSLQLNGYSAGLEYDARGNGFGGDGSVFFGKVKIDPNSPNDHSQIVAVIVYDRGTARYLYRSDSPVSPRSNDHLAIVKQAGGYSFLWNERQVATSTLGLVVPDA